MTRTLAGLAALAAALGLSAARADTPPPEKNPGRLDVFDEAKLFSPAGVEKAKEKFRETQFHHGLTVTVDTVKEPPADKKSAAESAQHDKTKWRTFMLDWARETAKADRAKGVYVLITLHPTGGVAVIADKQTTQRGFTEADDQKVRDILIAALKEAKAEKDEAKQPEVRSAGLLKAVEYVAGDLKDTRVADLPPAGTKTDAEHRGGTTHANQPRQGGSGIMGYVCLGLFVLAGAWLVIGLIRMFTGGGGGGAGAPGGGGGGG
ncbi:MAG TPA: hypothetical protein VH092_10490, partial [Urbifossiella sp.]|nr:hypothetical protein [Urbifossiella sp.]